MGFFFRQKTLGQGLTVQDAYSAGLLTAVAFIPRGNLQQIDLGSSYFPPSDVRQSIDGVTMGRLTVCRLAPADNAPSRQQPRSAPRQG